MAHEWDECFARDAVPLKEILPDWFPKSYGILSFGFAASMEQELRALRLKMVQYGKMEQFLSTLAPEAVGKYHP